MRIKADEREDKMPNKKRRKTGKKRAENKVAILKIYKGIRT